MKILKQDKNVLLERTDIQAEYEHVKKVTPTIKDVTKELASHFKTKEELIKINHIYTDYGGGNSRIIASAYDNENSMKAIEVFNKKKKQEKQPAKEGGE